MEITFDELIEETPLHELLSIPEKDLVKELMQKVREATKEECRDIASEFSLHETLKHIDNLPTDRIKTEE